MQRMLSTSFRPGMSVRSQEPLTDEQIRIAAPSIFAVGAHESRSQRYAYVPTSEIISRLRGEGFQPFFVAQTRCRDEDKTPFTKHMIRFRHANEIGNAEGANEIVAINSHDGTSGYQMLAGYLRFVCQNGCVAGDIVENYKIKHSGRIQDEVIEVAYRILQDLESVDESREAMMGIQLSEDETQLFGSSVLALRYPQEAPITPEQILLPRRTADAGDSLWRTFNRAQENLIRGGIRIETPRGERQRSTREIRSIDSSVGLNRALWNLSEGMRALKETGHLPENLAVHQ